MRESRNKAVRDAMSEKPTGKHIECRFAEKENNWQNQILRTSVLSLSAGAVAYILSQNNPFGRSS